MATKSLKSNYMKNSMNFKNYFSSDESITDQSSNENSDEYCEMELDQRRNVLKRLRNATTTTTTMAGKSIKIARKRKPTRTPDPNTFNRNALMARENRRRKKEYVEQLEKEIDIFRWTNKNLRKMFEKQGRLVKRLQNEKQYYRNLLENNSEILAAVDAIKTNVSHSFSLTKETPETSPSYSFSDSLHNNNFDEFDYNIPLGGHESWENLLGCDSPFAAENTKTLNTINKQNYQDIQMNIIDEHNYFNTKSSDNLYDNPGVCLHIKKGGKISVEFCSNCHKNSSERIDERVNN